ncbi:MAG TPA: enoyl-CoA hydratase [Deltaproteobacteria bacterium]|nr:enoyl-CoA hydratase [Deltaproteobacteria bacterium]
MSSEYTTLLVERDQDVVTLTLNRPELHNAFNEVMIAELTRAFERLGKDSETRALVLTGAGESFCAGADLNWMKKVAAYTSAQNKADALRLHKMLLAVYRCPKPVIAKINGAAVGGGVGLVAAADIAFAAETARFGFSEVRLGLIPAVISPFVMCKIGEANAREYFLSGERFSAARAKEMGLVQYVAAATALPEQIQEKLRHLRQGGPTALAACKKLIEKVGGASLEKMGLFTSAQIAARRSSPEGKEGMNAFLAKRKPNWISSS